MASVQHTAPGFVDFPYSKELTDHCEVLRQRLTEFQRAGGRDRIQTFVNDQRPEEALELIRAGTSNLVGSSSFKKQFGEIPAPDLIEIFHVLLKTTEGPHEDIQTLMPLFDAFRIRGITLDWEVYSTTLWLLNPDAYFPVRIADFRSLAEKLGHPFCKEKEAHYLTYEEAMRFGKAIRRVCEPAQPRDWVDVCTFISECHRAFASTPPPLNHERPTVQETETLPEEPFFLPLSTAKKP